MTRCFVRSSLIAWCLIVGAYSLRADSQLSAESYKRRCDHDPMHCATFIDGLITGVLIGGGELEKRAICLPKVTTFHQLYLVVDKYIVDHPQDIHLMYGIVVDRALAKAFPCGNGR